MKLLTEVSLPEYPFSLNHRSQVLMMGSCFTENIGRLLERYLFPVCINPFGVTYNPLSVKKGLEALLHKDAYQAEDLDRHNGQWLSFDHDTSFSSTDRDKCLDKINRSFQEAKEQLKQARILILTWGTSWVYRYRASGEVVCNCHKIPEREFTRSRLTPREIITAYESLLPGLFAFNKQLKILHTVSPGQALEGRGPWQSAQQSVPFTGRGCAAGRIFRAIFLLSILRNCDGRIARLPLLCPGHAPHQ
jgi:hypothetical protein